MLAGPSPGVVVPKAGMAFCATAVDHRYGSSFRGRGTDGTEISYTFTAGSAPAPGARPGRPVPPLRNRHGAWPGGFCGRSTVPVGNRFAVAVDVRKQDHPRPDHERRTGPPIVTDRESRERLGILPPDTGKEPGGTSALTSPRRPHGRRRSVYPCPLSKGKMRQPGLGASVTNGHRTRSATGIGRGRGEFRQGPLFGSLQCSRLLPTRRLQAFTTGVGQPDGGIGNP